MGDDKPTAYRARWVLPGDGPPVSGGVVTGGGGRILAVEESGACDVDLDDVVLAPGFVNVHCHLDLSDSPPLRATPSSFVDWLRSVVAHRRTKPPLGVDALVSIVADIKRRGTAVLGDVTLGNIWRKATAAERLAGITFGEVIGHREERYQPLLEEIASCADQAVNGRRIGFSPHAPYSTAQAVYQTPLAKPKCTHWLESPDEVEFLRSGGGPMKDFLQDIGAWPESTAPGPWDDDPWADLLGDPSEWLLVHANFVTKADLEHALRLSAGKPLNIAYCPRTHAAFGFNEYPLAMLLGAGCRIGLGTDSLASNPDLDVFNEAVFVAERFPQFANEHLLRMLTHNGAALLGCDRDYGSITPDKAAAIVVLRSPGQGGKEFDWPRFFSRETTVLGWLGDESAAIVGTS